MVDQLGSDKGEIPIQTAEAINSIEREEARTIDAQVSARVNTRKQNQNQSTAEPERPLPAGFEGVLDGRLKDANIASKGWQGRESELKEVFVDLERFARKDPGRALALWRKHVPDEVDLPPALEGPQGAAERATQNEEKDDEREKVFVSPPSLAKRYLQAENRYYFRDDQNTVAFEDKGHQIATDHHDIDVARSMVELAQAKGWAKLNIKGSAEFKREVWLEASLRNLESTGHTPAPVDRARLAELKAERAIAAERRTERASRAVTSALEPAKGPQHPVDERKLSPQQTTAVEALKAILHERGDTEKQVAAAVSIATERFQNNRVYVGKFVEHGSAPYEFNKTNEHTHFVRLATAQGERVVWGVDLKRAIEEGNVKKGDDVAIAYQGAKQVTITVKDRDDQGLVIGQREIQTKRNAWAVQKVETLRADALAKLNAAAERSSKQPVVKIYDPKAPRQTPQSVPLERQRPQDRSR